MGSNTTGLPTNTAPLPQEARDKKPEFILNGALRAHVVRSECCLLMAMLHLHQETVVGYLKAGLNLRRGKCQIAPVCVIPRLLIHLIIDIAYSSYSLVWQEYKRMGQEFNTYMDKNTISAIQFG